MMVGERPNIQLTNNYKENLNQNITTKLYFPDNICLNVK